MKLFDRFRPYAKALAALVVPLAGGVLAAMQSESPGGTSVTRDEVLAILLAAMASHQLVFWTKNVPPAVAAPVVVAPTGKVPEIQDPTQT